MFQKQIKSFIANYWLAILVATILYLVFFGKIFHPDYYFWGSDARFTYYPGRHYLYETIINEHRFPFWTEKQYSGFPIYADFENAFLHIPNVILILIFGPLLSYTLIHFFSYLAGALSIFYMFKKRGFGLLSYTIAILIYYFSFFNINHQIHYNIITVTYLFPLQILLAYLFVEKRQARYLLLQSLVIASGMYWGHIQTVIISIMGVTLYLIAHLYRTPNGLKTFFTSITTIGVASIVWTIPILTTAAELFLNSHRVSTITYSFGSMTVSSVALAVYPYLFGKWDNYVGNTVRQTYSYTEMYIYGGIAAITIAIVAIMIAKRTRDYYFAYLTILLFLILAFLVNWPFLNEETPLIGIFRYWVRTWYVSLLGILFLVGIVIKQFEQKIDLKQYLSIMRSNLIFLIAPIAYLVVLDFIAPERINKYSLIQVINVKGMIQSIDFQIWFSLAFCTAIILAGLMIKGHIKKFKVPFLIFLTLLVFTDYMYFGQDVLNARIRNMSTERHIEGIEGYEKKRIIYKTLQADGLEHLYYDHWSPFGYSQLINHYYYRNGRDIGFKSIKKAEEVRGRESNYINFKQIGVTDVIYPPHVELEDVKIIEYELDLIQEPILEGEYIKKDEGHIILNIYNNPQSQNLKTYIANYPDWRIKVNGQKVTRTNQDNDLFISFKIPEGENILIDMKYIPMRLYIGIAITLISALILYFVYIIQKEKFYKFISKK